MSGLIPPDEMPACECDHDFWDGLNFHFPRCPKHGPVEDASGFFFGLHMVLGGKGVRRLGSPRRDLE